MTISKMRFEERVAIVTGAYSTRGIGRSITLDLPTKDTDIVITDMKKMSNPLKQATLWRKVRQ